MKAKFALVGAAVLAVLSLSCSKKSTSNTGGNQPGPNTVIISDFSFNPDSIAVAVGTTVTWRNNGPSSHTVTSDVGTELNSPLLGQNATYTHTFNNSGTFDYHCTPHPFMQAKVVVQ